MTEAALSTVRDRLDDVARRFASPSSTNVTFVVLTALAEGADRLIAEQALELLADRGVELNAILPMHEAEYRNDFPDSVSEFDKLLRPPTIKTELPPVSSRDEAYEVAGQYIVDHSDVLIALWDGHAPSGRGGTAEIVGYARRHGIPVLVVPTRRAADPHREPQPPEWARAPWALPDSTSESYKRIDEFNRRRAVSADIEREQARVGEPAEGSPTHWQYVAVASWALPRFVRADSLALRYEKLYYRLGAGLYTLAALAVTAIAAQSQWHWSPRIALVEVGFMLTLLALYGIARHVRVHERWVGYRSLTEAFRSSLFILLSDVPRSSESRTRELCATDDPWFQRAFSETWRGRPTIQPEPGNAGELRQFLTEAWLEDQIHYHRGAVKRFRHGRERLTTMVFLLFSATVVIGILHAFDVPGGPSWQKLFTFLAITLPGFGAALVGIRDQRQFRIQEDRSARTASRLERLRRDMQSQTTLHSVQQLAAQIQTLIEAENLDWSAVIEFQDLEMVL